MHTKLIVLIVASGLLCAQGVTAQTTPNPKIFIIINGGYQVTSNDFTNSATKRVNAEDGQVDAAYTVPGGFSLDIAGGAMIWRQLGVGVGFSRFSVATPATLTASIPHPFFFNRGRAVSGSATGLEREEITVHVQVRAVLPLNERFQAAVFGGPSFFSVNQGLVTDITYSESYPFDMATFGSATTTSASASKVGFNVGGELAYFFTPRVGLGGTIRYGGSTVELPGLGGAPFDAKVGGLTVGGGLHLRF